MLTEINPPFGDTAGFWASTTVNNGQHTFQVRALNDAGTVLATNTITATVANQTPPPPPPSTTGAVTQTIANGATAHRRGQLARRLRQERRHGRGRPRHDRSSYVDGTQVLSEINPPFGDTAGFWTSTTVNDGQHTFQVRALNDAGTVLATNTITATVANKPTPARPVTPLLHRRQATCGSCRRPRRVSTVAWNRGHRQRRRHRLRRLPRRHQGRLDGDDLVH